MSISLRVSPQSSRSTPRFSPKISHIFSLSSPTVPSRSNELRIFHTLSKAKYFSHSFFFSIWKFQRKTKRNDEYSNLLPSVGYYSYKQVQMAPKNRTERNPSVFKSVIGASQLFLNLRKNQMSRIITEKHKKCENGKSKKRFRCSRFSRIVDFIFLQ